ncbi:hypothetical protein L1049_028487 [Liquidambar formosana]|uniref:Uncharacterized protein n=1 Tax=Liquidambar formosana TaxID=63359 RepID=A0AAP0WWA6_LIQFO
MALRALRTWDLRMRFCLKMASRLVLMWSCWVLMVTAERVASEDELTVEKKGDCLAAAAVPIVHGRIISANTFAF